MRNRRQYFTLARSEIASINLNTMFTACGVAIIFVIFFFFISPFIVKGWTVTPEYIALLPIFGFFFIFSLVYKRRGEPNYYVMQTACIVAYCLLLTNFVVISVFPYPDDPETFVSLFIMIMPVMFIMRPLIVLIISVILGGVFILLTLTLRNEVCIAHDVFSTIASILFSQLIAMFVYRLRIADYLSRDKLTSMSESDSLTQILNKSSCENACDSYIKERPDNSLFALIIIDIDDFKNINDQYGHQAGDDLLVLLGDVLRNAFRQSDIVGRIGGDEFCVLMKNVPGSRIVREKTELVSRKINERAAAEHQLNMTCSVGIAVLNDKDHDFKDCYKLADDALYKAKQGGKSRSCMEDIAGIEG